MECHGRILGDDFGCNHRLALFVAIPIVSLINAVVF